MWPWRSPRICTSMWRARRTKRSRNTASLPKAAAASRRASSSLPANSAALSTTRMPRPPPPKAALTISGKPISAAIFSACFASVTGFFGAGNHRNARLLRQPPRRRLVAQQVEQIRAGTDEGDSRPFAGARQRRILREKAIARMDGIHAFFLRQRDDAFHVEVGLHRPLALRRSGRLHRP